MCGKEEDDVLFFFCSMMGGGLDRCSKAKVSSCFFPWFGMQEQGTSTTDARGEEEEDVCLAGGSRAGESFSPLFVFFVPFPFPFRDRYCS